MVENYVGQVVVTSSRYEPGGLKSPHVDFNSVHWSNGYHIRRDVQFSVHSRRSFDEGSGPTELIRPKPRPAGTRGSKNTRGWKGIERVYGGPSRGKARDYALAEAKRLGVVLIETGWEGDENVERITWHPEGWEPEFAH